MPALLISHKTVNKSISRPCCIALLLSIAVPGISDSVFDPEAALDIRSFAPSALPTLSPGGELVAYGVTDPQVAANVAGYWPYGTLHVLRTDGTRVPTWPKDIRGSHPTWSPDGTRLAFVRERGTRSQLSWWHVESGELQDIGPEFPTLSPLQPGNRFGPLWIPDGSALIAPIPELSPQLLHDSVTVLRNTEALLPGDEAFIDEQTWRLLRVDINNEDSRTLSSGQRLRELELSNNGAYWRARAVVPDSDGHFEGDTFVEQLGEWIAPVDGRTPARRFDNDGAPVWAALAPDGLSISYLEGRELRQRNLDDDHSLCANVPASATGIASAPDASFLIFTVSVPAPPLGGSPWLIPPATANDLVLMDVRSCRVTTLLSRDLGEAYDSLTWSADASSFFFRGRRLENLRERLYRAAAPKFAPELVYEADEIFSALSPSADGTKLLFLGEHARRPAEIWLWRKEKSGGLRLTDLNPQLAAYSLVSPELIDFETTSGKSRRALLFLPPQASPQSPAPVVVYIYSWLSASKNRFLAHAQMHVSRGYAFLMPDVGIGIADLHQPYIDSVIPALDQARSTGLVSGTAGINGGSLGGYGGLILLAESRQFSAAVLRAPPTEFATSWATGKDRDAALLEALMDGSPFEVPERYRRHSPFVFADRIEAPLLLLHGRDDEQVPLSQGVLMFQALRRLGRTTEMVIYDGADHSIVRGSRRYYSDYYTRTLDWWDQYLNEHRQ